MKQNTHTDVVTPTEEQILFYRENGYVIISDIFTDAEANKYNQYIRRHANKDFAAIVNPDRYEDLYEQDERCKSDVTLEEIQETVQFSQYIMKHPRVVSILETLQGQEVVGLSSQFIFKEAFTSYSSQAWRPHQDGWYPGDKNGEYITANWFLRRADVENGTIYVYRGSHEAGLRKATARKSFREDPHDNPGSDCSIPEQFANSKADVIIPANSVVFLHGHCIHGSHPNHSNRSRPWYSCCYISKGEQYFTGKNAKRREITLKEK